VVEVLDSGGRMFLCVFNVRAASERMAKAARTLECILRMMVDGYYFLRSIQAARPPMRARVARVRTAHRQRLAHFSSALRMWSMKAWRSASVFSGIQVGETSLEGGSRRGEMRMKAPKIQKSGNTESAVSCCSSREE
jgi:hypothetical protein